ncbi:DUF5060 domain-containing protein [Opitutus sp. ER46]|uniref:DUF5060 domain-containing protein n=1 Tax=Opitutus sp. ER46 TaxID=2161864 RepID=UPI000D2F4DFB|nr:DUF5060 domain-containing protein [Opitutus sp. ER46]PTX91393.1 hypothetical protein DB354_15980 [Opitutus sp. ER46]
MFRLRFSIALLALATLPAALPAGPLTFAFTPPAAPEIRNPFARELWGRVVSPSGRVLLLPAYYAGDGVFAVRARPDEIGAYRLEAVLEDTRGATARPVTVEPRSATTLENKQVLRLPPVGVSTRHPDRFARADGRAFIPFGANLAWTHGEVVPWYREAFRAFAAANLNWARVWMVHWGGTNLDWPREGAGPAPAPGGIDPTVAARWDELLAAAEEQGVYLQVVFQHHGQYSSAVNPSWAENPWNAANPGGFLKSPSDFFTDPNARLFTALKYRYIVARWGWSPAVFAWELFNEVHWVDALRIDHNEAAVARWHDDMATLVRSIDAYAHPITTSTEDLRSPIYAKMDFLQPHLYAADLIAAVRTFAPRLEGEKRPIFYGEFGVDHLPISAEARQSGLAEVIPVWASLMAPDGLPAQPWEGGKVLEHGRVQELGVVPRFLVMSGFARQQNLTPFSARVETDARTPLVLAGCQAWQRRPAREFTLPLDGREPLEMGDWPAVLVVPESERRDGFPNSGTFHADFPAAVTLRVTVAEVATSGGGLRVLVDGKPAAESFWKAPAAMPAELAVPVTAGKHTVRVENTGASDWVKVSQIDLGVTAPVLAALGQRNDHFIALWVRHRTNVLQPGAKTDASGTIVLDEVPAGAWSVTWWDTEKGTPAPAAALEHKGGSLRLQTPRILRHAAVVLAKAPAK